jgi:hypothetical protein
MAAANTEQSIAHFGIYFRGMLLALLGGLIGFIYMTSFTALAFSSEAEYVVSLEETQGPAARPRPGGAYYLVGDVSRTRSWQAKREQLAAAGEQTVKFKEGEINAWMIANLASGAAPAEEDQAGVLIIPSLPNVAIVTDGLVYFNLPTTITAYGTTNDFMISARLALDADGLQLQSLSVNSAKVPLPSLLGARILNFLGQAYQSTEDYKILSDALARADSVEVVGQELVFNLR